MAMSTMFTDSKVGQFMGSLFAFVPIILFMKLIQQDGNAKYLVYLLYVFPTTPALAILINILTAEIPEEIRV